MRTHRDRIIIKGMEFYGYHGALSAEQELGQRFLIDVEMYCDLTAAGCHDELAETIDYSAVYRLVQEIVIGPPCRLIEALAERIARGILAGYDVAEVLVRVKKPQAPLPGIFSYVAVEIRRERGKN